MVRAPAPRRRATNGSPEETMVTSGTRKRSGNTIGVGKKAASKEIAESSRVQGAALATEDLETTT